MLKNAFDKRYPECGARVKVYAVAHLLDPAYKGCVLEVYPGAYEAAREELLKYLKDFDKSPAPAAATIAVPGDDTEIDDDSNLSAVERLLKRRRISGDREESQPRTQSIPAPELELQTYEKLQVIIEFFRKKNILIFFLD